MVRPSAVGVFAPSSWRPSPFDGTVIMPREGWVADRVRERREPLDVIEAASAALEVALLRDPISEGRGGSESSWSAVRGSLSLLRGVRCVPSISWRARVSALE